MIPTFVHPLDYEMKSMSRTKNEQMKKKKMRVLKAPVVSNCGKEQNADPASIESSDEYKRKLQELQANWIKNLSSGDNVQGNDPTVVDWDFQEDSASGPDNSTSSPTLQQVSNSLAGDELEKLLDSEFNLMITEMKEVITKHMKEIIRKTIDHIKANEDVSRGGR